ncbi:MAG: hypothetical protein ABFQ53_03040 [Patescibacteria group bacterium]
MTVDISQKHKTPSKAESERRRGLSDVRRQPPSQKQPQKPPQRKMQGDQVEDVESERRRNLADTRIQQATQKEQEQQYMEELAGGIKTSHDATPQMPPQKPQPQTEAQKKQELKKAQKKSAKQEKAKKEKSKKGSRKHRRAVRRYENTPWPLLWTAVVMNIFGGLFTWAYGIGYLFTVPATLFIDVMLWNAVTGKERKKIRVMVVVATIVKNIPILGFIPASALLVGLTQKTAKQKVISTKMRKR